MTDLLHLSRLTACLIGGRTVLAPAEGGIVIGPHVTGVEFR